MQMKTETDTC